MAPGIGGMSSEPPKVSSSGRIQSTGKMARLERFELPTLCFEVMGFENLNALSSVSLRANAILKPVLSWATRVTTETVDCVDGAPGEIRVPGLLVCSTQI